MAGNIMRSGNPALNKNTFKNLTNTSGDVMTLDGAVNKTGISLLILLVAAYYTYSNAIMDYILIGFIGGFIVLVTILKRIGLQSQFQYRIEVLREVSPLFMSRIYRIVQGIF